MQKTTHIFLIFLCFSSFFLSISSQACTNILVTKGASRDGSVMLTAANDGMFYSILHRESARDYKPKTMLEVVDINGKKLFEIEQASHTYAVIGKLNDYEVATRKKIYAAKGERPIRISPGFLGFMNEHQLMMAESTFFGREELANPDGLIHYKDMMTIALQRAKTARHAIEIMTGLADEYGYNALGQSLSICDTNQAWILEIIGTGPGGKGAIWVAVRIPDGYVSCHTNKSVIAEFPLDDPENCLYSKNVISFAIEKGYYNPHSGKPFRYCDAYCPATPAILMNTAGRTWSILRRVAPSLNLSPDYFRAVEDAKPYPMWVKPDKKLLPADVFGLMRDYFDGTEFDMTKGIEAGPFGTPCRWKPNDWTVDRVEYSWPRGVSTHHTGYTFVAQARDWLPDGIGGLIWYGVDNAYTTCYTPYYCCIDSLPKSYTIGNLNQFSWDSAWWIFNLVSNYANLKYSYMIKDIQARQKELEEQFFAMQPVIEKTALELAKANSELMTQHLTNYSITQAESTVENWRQLAAYLIAKYNDGYVNYGQAIPQRKKHPEQVGYPEQWLKQILSSEPEKFRPEWKKHSRK